MKIKYFIYCFILLSIFSYSCTYEEVSRNNNIKEQILQKIQIVEKKPVKVINKTPNGVTFFRPIFIRYNKYDNNVYVVDSGNHRIVVFDEDLNYIKELGKYGQGLGEFDTPVGIAFMKNGNFIVTDKENRRRQIYDNNFNIISQFRDVIGLAHGMYVLTDSHDKIYIHMNYPFNGFLFTIKDNKGEEIAKFGKIFKYETKEFEAHENDAHYILDSQDNLYCAFMNYPILRKYDNNYNLLYEIDYSYIPGVKNQLKKWNKIMETKKNKLSYYYSYKLFIRCISVDNEYLYIKFYGEEGLPIYIFEKENFKLVKKLVFNENDHLIIQFDFSAKEYFYTVNPIKMTVSMFKK